MADCKRENSIWRESEVRQACATGFSGVDGWPAAPAEMNGPALAAAGWVGGHSTPPFAVGRVYLRLSSFARRERASPPSKWWVVVSPAHCDDSTNALTFVVRNLVSGKREVVHMTSPTQLTSEWFIYKPPQAGYAPFFEPVPEGA